MYTINTLAHLCSYKADITNNVYFGETPLGKRYDVSFEGTVTGQKLSGKMHGIDYLLERTDGVLEINVRAVLVTTDNVNISVEISGYVCGEELKDTQIRMMTGHEKYQWLMSKIIIGKGKTTDNGLALDYYYEP